MGTSIFGNTGGSLIGTDVKLYNAIVTLSGTGTDAMILIGTVRQQEVDYQILRALTGDFAINVFGDHPVRMDLSGLQPVKPIAEDTKCKRDAGSGAVITKALAESIETWYKKHKMSAAEPLMVNVAIGGEVFSGLAYRLITKPTSAAQGGYEYILSIIALPSKNGA